MMQDLLSNLTYLLYFSAMKCWMYPAIWALAAASASVLHPALSPQPLAMEPELHDHGVRGVLLDWFRGYLSNRTQTVLHDVSSDVVPVKYGVPQGSILRLLLFLIYDKDLPNAANNLFSVLYADDTDMFTAGKNIGSLVSNLNNILLIVTGWWRPTNYLLISIRHIIWYGTQKLFIGQNCVDRIQWPKSLKLKKQSSLVSPQWPYMESTYP